MDSSRERRCRWLALARAGNAVGRGVTRQFFTGPAAPGLNLGQAFEHPEAAGDPWKGFLEQARLGLSDAAIEIARAEEQGARVIDVEDDEYPALLREISDAPPVLFVRGSLLPRDDRSVAIVGSRAATEYGARMARRFAEGLVRHGATIVSGLAKGIDSCAHRAALDAGGRTIAVLGTGIDVPYPRDASDLYEAISARGAVISEAPPGTPAYPACFLTRNRIVSGLCRALVVVEARLHSGTSNTVAHARAQGREVCVVPGDVDLARSAGTNRHLVEGAWPVRDAADVLFPAFKELYLDPPAAAFAAPELPDRERSALSALLDEPATLETIAARAGMPVPSLLAALSGLERRGLAHRDCWGRYARFGKSNATG